MEGYEIFLDELTTEERADILFEVVGFDATLVNPVVVARFAIDTIPKERFSDLLFEGEGQGLRKMALG